MFLRAILIISTGCIVRAFSPLQALVSLEATASTIAQNFNREMFSESLILNSISKSHYIGSDIISSGLIGFALINRYSNKNYEDESKWSKIAIYSKTRKLINNLLLIIMIIFTKNIENAI
jgi:hypothetical protein